MFQAILLIIFIALLIGGIVSVIQYFKTETKSSTPTPTVKDLEATGTLQNPISASTSSTSGKVTTQITDSVTLPVGGASANTSAGITPKAKTKKKRYYYKPKGAKANKP